MCPLHYERPKPLALGGSDAGELESETFPPDPPNNALVDTQRPRLVLKEERKFQRRPHLHFRHRSRLAPARREVEDGGFAFQFILSEEEKPAIHPQPTPASLTLFGIGEIRRSRLINDIIGHTIQRPPSVQAYRLGVEAPSSGAVPLMREIPGSTAALYHSRKII